MTLYSIIKYIFNDRKLFITGGFGESFKDRIIIHRSIDNDYIGDEYKILEYLTAIKKGYAYSMIQQSRIRSAQFLPCPLPAILCGVFEPRTCPDGASGRMDVS